MSFVLIFSYLKIGLSVALVLVIVLFGIGVWVINVIGRKSRYQMAPLCMLEYSSEQWKEYAISYGLSDKPAGNAKIKITILDIWIVDENRSVQNVLDGLNRCVTACKLERGVLSIRVRGYTSTTMSGFKSYYHYDYRFPVPAGNEAEAAKVVAFFQEQIARNSFKIASVIADDNVEGIFGETGF